MNILLMIFGGICLSVLLLIAGSVGLYIILERREHAQHPVPRTCEYCRNYHAGDVDARVNYCVCDIGHRLIAEEEKTIQHTTSNGEKMMVTNYGWSGGKGFGPPMLNRDDCPDWKRSTGCSEIHSMEY